MKATIISIGNELIIGQVVNSNAAYMAEQLNLVGLEIDSIITIGDDRDKILQSLHDSQHNSRVVLITGGLGPTSDDITKEVLCEYFNSRLIYNEDVFNNIRELFSRRKQEVTERNRLQAMVPHNCELVPNELGTAPGMWFEKDNIMYIAIPGVPFEMVKMTEEQIIPRLMKKLSAEPVLHYTVLTQGIGESHLSDLIAPWEKNLPEHIRLGYLPQPGIVRLRLSASGKNINLLKKDIEETVRKLQDYIGDYIWGFQNDTLEEVVGSLLRKSNSSLSTAESCTGGYIAHLITSVPGSSDYFKGSVVAYANDIKEHILGVSPQSIIDFGAVSEQAVVEMAKGVKEKFNTHYSIAVSGIAGPDGGTTQKPVGTVCIAIGSPDGITARRFLFGKDRIRNIRMTAVTALNMLRKTITG